MGLFQPVWKSENKEKAIKSVKKITNRTKLKKIIKNAPLEEVRVAAYEKLQNALVFIINNDYNPLQIRSMALDELSDQEKLVDIVKSNIDFSLREKAVNKITEQSALADIAKNVYLFFHYVISKLTDRSLLIDVVKNANDKDVRTGACAKLGHDFNGCKCKLCGNVTRHEWNKCVCTICGELSDFPHLKGGNKREENESDHAGPWVSDGQCRKKCSACGARYYDHTLNGINSGSAPYQKYKCSKCDYEGTISIGYQGEAQRKHNLKFQRGRV
jgi:hypothetical protein